eukprot:TRINITY_DN4320_c0_g1_i1.p1 TRINITY_DN4320_c0_g1~~TRINITY_DN4320_c0_g1_i1.p1  ORF type:complete len:262 (-),score=137.48 TRINITY_DN4320_c0_g1_i1:90-875(-)
MAAKSPRGNFSQEELTKRYTEVVSHSIEEQAKFFLRAFVLDFQGNFEEVLDLAQEFSKFAPKEGVVRELDEVQAHVFLEKRGETMTVKELRDQIKEIDLDKNHKVAFVEYALFRYKKTLAQLFTPPAGASPEALAALEKAIEDYQKTLETRKARDEKMAHLAEIAKQGGVKGKAAQNELEQMQKQDQLEQNKKEVLSAAAKRKAQKAVEESDYASKQREVALKAEQERLEAEKKKKEEEEARKKAESRERLKAKASLWDNK